MMIMVMRIGHKLLFKRDSVDGSIVVSNFNDIIDLTTSIWFCAEKMIKIDE